MKFPAYISFVLTIHEPNHTITTALEILPPFERSLITDHFIDGDSVWTLMKRHDLKRSEVEAFIEAGLATMLTALRSRGVRAVADLI